MLTIVLTLVKQHYDPGIFEDHSRIKAMTLKIGNNVLEYSGAVKERNEGLDQKDKS